MEKTFDIAIIGSGPGGYVAAIRASQLGYKVAIIEKYPVLGGTCTNVGCIPSKALLDSSEHFHNAQRNFQTHGIGFDDVTLDFNQFISRKDQVVKSNNAGLDYLMKKNKITVFQGLGSFISKNEINIRNVDSEQKIKSNYTIIATGSKPSTIPGIIIDKKRIITSTEALSLKNKPKSLTIIGGGVIGVEMASVFARIGSKVTIIEYADSIIPTMDYDLGKELYKILKRQNIDIYLNAKVEYSRNKSNSAVTKIKTIEGEIQEFNSEYALVAVGRKPFTESLGLENIGVQTERGFIPVNKNLQTTVPNIYAIGDVIGGAMLAHKAEEEGIFVAETINGQKPHIKYNLIPGVVYTWPEIASVGFTEDYLIKKEIPYRIGKFPFKALGRVRAAGENDGFVKVLSDAKYGELLGVHIIGPRAADLIAQAVVAMEYEITDAAMGKISYAHPTYAEALKEAYLGASGIGAINI